MTNEKDRCCETSTQDTCCSGAGVKTLILACSGGSNVGQISNQIMIELDKDGTGNAYCLSGIGAAMSGFIESAKAARTILIDGCPVSCGKKVFEKYGIKPSDYFIVTELGIEKTHDFSKLKEETDKVLNTLKTKI
ncbi:MAG TPA: putative zinc-binding protein [Syntrophorhabdaceae bacterium]|nr:putative zinc-binding protein [Syntrophorhabdaceae bacterium]HPP07057.1 putative zinc-binding protein [Syntrophorhabdaceae bacterium]